MTVSSEISTAGPYFGNGSTTVFPYGFKILDETQIAAVIVEGDFVVTTLSLEAGDYTVTSVGSEVGGTIVKATPLLTGQKLTLARSPKFTQETSLENQGPYYPEVIESRFDILTMQVQAVKEGVDRALTVPLGETRPEITDVFTAVRVSGESADAAEASAVLSQRYANDPEDSPIVAGLYSALHWFRKAFAQATAAATSAATANTRATAANTSATNAATSATGASGSATAAATSATNAGTSATAAQTARTGAETAKTAAETARTQAQTAQSGANTSATNAATSETNAGNSASAAATSAGTASTKATEATTARDFSYKWSSEAEDTQVNDGVRTGYSAYHWSKKAENAAGGGVLSWAGRTGNITLAQAQADIAALPLAGGSLTGRLVALASSTAGAGVQLPHGAAPTTPVNGELWTQTTGLFYRINGTTRQAYDSGSLTTMSTAQAQAGTSTTVQAMTAQALRAGVIASPVGTATQNVLDAKAPLDSPALIGTPTVPTAPVGTNNSQAANTAFVVAALSANPPFTSEGGAVIGAATQNNSGKPLFITASRSAQGASTGTNVGVSAEILAGPASSSMVRKAYNQVGLAVNGISSASMTVAYMVPPGWWYQINLSQNSGSSNVQTWSSAVN